MSRKYKNLITHGAEEGLENVQFHNEAPFKRILMSGINAPCNFNKHIAIHHIINELSFDNRTYCVPHVHNCDEWNIILNSSNLKFEIMLNDECYEVNAPATIYIPKGIKHSANVIHGSGYFIAILDTLDYNNSIVV